MTKTETSKADAAGYYPVNIRIQGTRALVCGGAEAALAEATRLVDYGAAVDVVAPYIVAELTELAVTYGNRLKVYRRELSSDDEAKILKGHYCLVFALSTSDCENLRILNLAAKAEVLAYAEDLADSSFIVPTSLKRGHLKIAVSTDAISRPTERALLQSIEANLVNDIDRYVLFLTKMHERLDEISEDPDLMKAELALKVTHQLQDSEELYLAVRRQNFDEANRLAERIILEFKNNIQPPAQANHAS